MSLKQNSRFDYQYPIRYLAGALLRDRPGCNVNSEMNDGDFCVGGFSKLSSSPNGYVPPYCLYPATKSGGLASYGRVNGVGVTNTPIILKGINKTCAISGVATISASSNGIGSPSSDIICEGIISVSDLNGVILNYATMHGYGDLSNVDLRAILDLVISMGGVGDMNTPQLNAGINIESIIPGFGGVAADIQGVAWCVSHITSDGWINRARLAGSVFMEADLYGNGDLVYVDLKPMLNLLANLAGTSDISWSVLNSVVGIYADIYSNGEVYTANLVGGKYISSSIDGVATTFLDLRGKGNISSYITIGQSVKPTAQDIANAVWDTTIAEHLVTGSTGKKLTDAASAGDPWGTPLPGAYTSGSAGFRLGTGVTVDVSEIDAALTSSHGSGSWVVTSGSGGGVDLTSSVGRLVWTYGSRSTTNARFSVPGGQ